MARRSAHTRGRSAHGCDNSGVMNAAGETPASVPWMADRRPRIGAVLPFAAGVWVALATVWCLTLGWHFALRVSAATWESILGFGTVVGLIFTISAPRPLPPAPRLAISAFLSGAVLIAGAWPLGTFMHAHYPQLEGPMDSPWSNAFILAYWLGLPWLLGRLSARVGR
jgi:hypothetical protein